MDFKIEKLFYSISEVAEIFDVNASLIRYWEKEFSVLKPKKTRKGNRMFTPKDIDHLKVIYHLVKEKGMTLKGAKQRMKDSKRETMDNLEVIRILENVRDTLIQIRNTIPEA